MDQKVQEYIVRGQEKERKKQGEIRDAHLIKLGLFDKMYAVPNIYTKEYPECEIKDGRAQYYKKVAKQVTEEEYAEICRLTASVQKEEEKEKPIDVVPMRPNNPNVGAVALRTIAIVVYVGGFIFGIILGNVDTVNYFGRTVSEFSFAAALSYWSQALISGTLLLGFGEIINLLQISSEQKYQIRNSKQK